MNTPCMRVLISYFIIAWITIDLYFLILCLLKNILFTNSIDCSIVKRHIQYISIRCCPLYALGTVSQIVTTYQNSYVLSTRKVSFVVWVNVYFCYWILSFPLILPDSRSVENYVRIIDSRCNSGNRAYVVCACGNKSQTLPLMISPGSVTLLSGVSYEC